MSDLVDMKATRAAIADRLVPVLEQLTADGIVHDTDTGEVLARFLLGFGAHVVFGSLGVECGDVENEAACAWADDALEEVAGIVAEMHPEVRGERLAIEVEDSADEPAGAIVHARVVFGDSPPRAGNGLIGIGASNHGDEPLVRLTLAGHDDGGGASAFLSHHQAMQLMVALGKAVEARGGAVEVTAIERPVTAQEPS